MDEAGEFGFVTGYGITFKPAHRDQMHYILGLLNSSLLSRVPEGEIDATSRRLTSGPFRCI